MIHIDSLSPRSDQASVEHLPLVKQADKSRFLLIGLADKRTSVSPGGLHLASYRKRRAAGSLLRQDVSGSAGWAASCGCLPCRFVLFPRFFHNNRNIWGPIMGKRGLLGSEQVPVFIGSPGIVNLPCLILFPYNFHIYNGFVFVIFVSTFSSILQFCL